MRAHQDPQQRRRRCQGQRDSGQPGPQQSQSHAQTCRESGVVAREGPVARRRALGHRFRAAEQYPARALLVDDELDGLAGRVGEYGADPGEHRTGGAPGVTPSYGTPPDPHQQQREAHQRPVAGRLQQRCGPAGYAVDGPGQRAVHRRRGAVRHLHGPFGPQAARGEARDGGRSRPQDRAGGQGPCASGPASGFSRHEARSYARRRRDSRAERQGPPLTKVGGPPSPSLPI